MYAYQPSGVCSQRIDFELDGDTITYAKFTGGCDGNLKGICSLVAGQNVYDVIERLKGITCGPKSTSCPDQFATALKLALEQRDKRGEEQCATTSK